MVRRRPVALSAPVRELDEQPTIGARGGRARSRMNAMTEVTGATARAITRRLPAPVDLLALYAQLSDHGRRRDTALIETTAGRSIILDRASVRIECRGRQVRLDALTVGGGPVLELVQRQFVERIVSSA